MRRPFEIRTRSRSPVACAKLHVPGEVGIWILILGEMTGFAALFGAFIYDRRESLEVYMHGQEMLDKRLGLLNTLILLTSSWAVALGVVASREGRKHRAQGMFMLAIGCGLVFVFFKIVEYRALTQAGAAIFENAFFSFYFILTGLHLVHVLLGMILLAVLWSFSGRAAHNSLIESGGCYWHMVDLIWIAMFPVLYLLK